LRLNVNDDKYVMLEAAIGFEPQLCDELVSIIATIDFFVVITEKNGFVKRSKILTGYRSKK